MDGLREVEADLLGVDVESGDELQVGHVVVTELHVHQSGHGAARVSIAVVVHALDQGRCAVSDANDGDADGGHPRSLLSVPGALRADGFVVSGCLARDGSQGRSTAGCDDGRARS
ncbi:hypothetical protein D3C74_352890 [compost metagenome]